MKIYKLKSYKETRDQARRLLAYYNRACERAGLRMSRMQQLNARDAKAIEAIQRAYDAFHQGRTE